MIDKALMGWKEYELELLRDDNNNVVIICSIENMDPMGIHTGDSITVAPAMTLSDTTYQKMRDMAIHMMRSIGDFDDYINKPIKPKLLVGKVKSLLRRLNKNKVTESKNVINLGDLIIDREEYKITHNKNEILLPRKEFELLYLLASKPGKVFKREVILEKIWGHEVVVGDRTIDVHIRKLREKLGDTRIKTIKGVGYKFKNK